MKPRRWSELAAALGLSPGTLAGAIEQAEPAPAPLLSRMMAGMGAWIAGCLFSGAAVALLRLLDGDNDALLPLGALLAAAAVALVWWSRHVIAEQAGLVLLATALAWIAVGGNAGRDWETTAGILGLSAALLAGLYRDAFARSVLVFLALGCFAVAVFPGRIDGVALAAHGAASLLVVALGAGAGRVSPLAELSRPVIRGGVLAFLAGALFSVLEEIPARESSLLSAVAAVGLSGAGVALGRDLRVRVLAVVFALLVAALGAPGVLAGTLGILVAVWLGDRVILSLAVAYTVCFVGWYYYDLDATLLEKSGALAVTGLACLGLRAWLQRAYPPVPA